MPTTINPDPPQQPPQIKPPQPPAPPQMYPPYRPYPAAAMVMQHQIMPPPPHPPHMYPHPPYRPYPHYIPVQQPRPVHQGGSNSENKTIWVGDLHPWMDENYLHNCFASTNEVKCVKIIRNKQNGSSEGYGFVDFSSHDVAEEVLQSYANVMMPNIEQLFRLNWASFATSEKRSDKSPDLSIFVGDLASDVTDTLLHEIFLSKYPSVKSAKVVIDPNTGRSKSYGFVRFGDEGERSQAMTEMNGVMCSTRAMNIGPATPRKSFGNQQGFVPNGHSFQLDGDYTNTTVFVGNLDPNVTDEDLRQPFSQYGEIVSVKIPPGKGCGFIQYASRSDAEEALQKLDATKIGNQTVRLSWGRSPANKQVRGDFGNQWGIPNYGGPPMYGRYRYVYGYGYGMMAPPFIPSMYPAAGAYPFYRNQSPPQVS